MAGLANTKKLSTMANTEKKLKLKAMGYRFIKTPGGMFIGCRGYRNTAATFKYASTMNSLINKLWKSK